MAVDQPEDGTGAATPRPEPKYLYVVEYDVNDPEIPPKCIRAEIAKTTATRVVLKTRPLAFRCRTYVPLDLITPDDPNDHATYFYSEDLAWKGWEAQMARDLARYQTYQDRINYALVAPRRGPAKDED